MMKKVVMLFMGRFLAMALAVQIDQGLLPSNQLDELRDWASSDLTDHTEEKRAGGKWKMRMFKRGPEVEESDPEEPEYYDENDVLDVAKRDRSWKMRMFKKKDPWKMRMFKKGQPWKMRMFKRLPANIQTELEKRSPWKMRMFKRLSMNRNYGKRPDKWQMRMFKREDEALAEEEER